MRENVTSEEINKILKIFKEHYEEQVRRKGSGAFASRHEIYGVLSEEVFEVLQNLHGDSTNDDFIYELLDVAVVCLFGAASIASGKVDW